MKKYDVIIIGAGAAGLFCGIHAAKRGRSVLILEGAKGPGKKILVSGGGRCNFTNLDVTPNFYVSNNPHFCKSALSQYTNWDFISFISEYNLTYTEKTLGQLFCDQKSRGILEALLKSIPKNCELRVNSRVVDVEHEEEYKVTLSDGTDFLSETLVLATGGLSFPGLGATDIGYRVAKKFGHKLIETTPALVPFTLDKVNANLAGIAIESEVKVGSKKFLENILWTHKGLSGPSILKASLYWNIKDEVKINFLPKSDLYEILKEHKKKNLVNALKGHLPSRFVELWLAQHDLPLNRNCAELSGAQKEKLIEVMHHWTFVPNGTEGYRKAEVTRGGVDTNQVSSKTMESRLQKNLYFVGEVLDVTGLLGGYNFQWAWSSGYVAAKYV
ncbi:NAD(P)/FAD-dependent oxidoreductase [Halobacteriovorax sp. DA5]|uniref:NAD(P)/FAD-dependent oxidoreductase n=1 Tax=unclassified Halobacteriovorax TaxID=2639665 RepID=UPI000CD1E23B|nr:NAD(P)/FAD-dependent oxidoreductase [Halobacteriovorax sp. DA5]POB12869.1 aminoacetone oxidase family FAD-binding enzyme [Halobacteriovorax sp. DA5]